MKISESSLGVCCKRRGIDKLFGFEDILSAASNDLTEEKTVKMFSELMDNKLIDMENEVIRVNALGQHVLNMMSDPDVFVVLENRTSQRKIRVYLRKTYYLCVMEEEGETGEKKLQIDYLPNLKLVVGAFAHALKPGTEPDEEKTTWDIQVNGMGLDKEGAPISEFTIYGDYEDALVAYQMQKTGDSDEQEEGKKELSDVINMVTTWMFDMISKTDESEVNEND